MIYLSIFLGGILSFFSPCVLPLLPLYLGYLSGGNLENKKRMIINTIFFTLGISFAFVILSFGFSYLGILLQKYRDIISKVSGILIIFLGFFEMEILKLNFLKKERKIFIDFKIVGPLTAFFLGFTFSFAWTPCVGPALSSILFTITTLKNIKLGYILMGIYTVGFIIPFLITVFFSSYFLNLFRKNMKFLKYSNKIMGTMLILFGILILNNKLNSVIGYLI